MTAAGNTAGRADVVRRGGGSKLLARCGPLALVAVSLLGVVGSFWVRDWRVGAVTVGVQLVLAAALVDRPRAAAVRCLPGALAALSVGFSTWLVGGHQVLLGVTAALRVCVLVLPGALLAAYVDPSRLGDQLGQQLRLPARPVVAVVASLQRFEQLGQTWGQLDRAARARGLGPGRWPHDRIRHVGQLTFGLLVATLRRSAQISVAMDARGFATATTRTWAEPARWTRVDTGVLLGGLALAALPVILSTVWP